jgi:glycosyltransferase involved in cell wall biosynthesis
VDQRTGWPVDAIDDVEAYRSVLRSILADPVVVERKGRAARQAVEEGRSWDAFVQQARAFYGAQGEAAR